jgi:hypothetical protein
MATSRFLGALLFVTTGVAVFLLSIPMLAPHPAWQAKETAKITSVTPDAVGNDMLHELLVVQAQDGNILDVDDDHGSVLGAQINVWILQPTDQAQYGSESPYPHQYNVVLVTLFVILCFVGLWPAGIGLHRLFRQRPRQPEPYFISVSFGGPRR